MYVYTYTQAALCIMFIYCIHDMFIYYIMSACRFVPCNLYTSTYVCECICACVHACESVCLHISLCVSAYVYVWMHVNLCVCTSLCVCVCMLRVGMLTAVIPCRQPQVQDCSVTPRWPHFTHILPNPSSLNASLCLSHDALLAMGKSVA